MRVIFLQDVPKKGRRHEVKEVNDGYALNFLIPKKLVERATPRAIAELEQRKKEIVVKKEIQEELLLKNLETIQDKAVVIKMKADDKGHLFSAIHPKEILKAMEAEHHASISPELITLERPIKEIGEFEIPIKVKNKKASFRLIVERA